MRLDELLVERGIYPNLHDAKAAVIAGDVVVGEHRADSAGMSVKADARVRIKAGRNTGGYVSRGGIKLEHALDAFEVDPHGLTCVDLGASSGGFTDCLLQRGAALVSAVDVGSGQFDWGLRNDTRVRLYERTNIRHVKATDIAGPFDLAVADLSFISLATVMDDIAGFMNPEGIFISLIKPQFEARRGQVESGGVVIDRNVHETCIREVLDRAAESGFEVGGLAYSPITGPAGNIEFLFWAKYRPQSNALQGSIATEDIHRVVASAHAELRSNS